MKKYTTKTVPEFRQKFIDAWGHLAPGATFSGMTLAEFTAETLPVTATRAAIIGFRNQLTREVRDRHKADRDLRELADALVNAIRGDRNYGANSALYKALGYVPKDERRRGLIRPGRDSADAPPPPADADAA